MPATKGKAKAKKAAEKVTVKAIDTTEELESALEGLREKLVKPDDSKVRAAEAERLVAVDENITRAELEGLLDDAIADLIEAQQYWDEIATWKEPYTLDEAYKMTRAYHDLRKAESHAQHLRNDLNRFDAKVSHVMDHHNWIAPDDT